MTRMLGALREAVLPGMQCAVAEACASHEGAEWHFHLPIRGHLSVSRIAEAFARHAAPEHAAYAPYLAALNAQELSGFLQGFMDRLAVHGGQWGVVDWKTNKLGEEEDAYSQHSMLRCAMESHYLLQVHLYLMGAAPLPPSGRSWRQNRRRMARLSAGNFFRDVLGHSPHPATGAAARSARPILLQAGALVRMTTPAFSTPEIEWLVTRWALPVEAIPTIIRYIDAETDGSTALRLPASVTMKAFGNAAASVGVGQPEPAEPKPLVIVQTADGHFLQSWRNYRVESEIARKLRARLDSKAAQGCDAAKLQKLFPGTSVGDLQAKAVEVALQNRLALITGGPGTGKTHTLVRILAMLIDQNIDPARIRLAAPTGKAADRMKKAVGEAIATLPGEFEKHASLLQSVAVKSSTLHLLLGFNPSTGQCRFNEKNPLPCDVLIVDECSMVDVLLWHALLRALRPETKLILVGDPNQLESVGRGNVLAALAQVARNTKNALHRVWIHLIEARRFKDRPGILALARAIENLDAAEAAKILSEATDMTAPSGVAWIPAPSGPLGWEQLPAPIQTALSNVDSANTPHAALEALSRVCILTAQREYFVGSKAMSETIERHFQEVRPVNRARNQPIIINENDPETGLRNGSAGVISIGAEGLRKAWFPSLADKPAIQEFSPAKLPGYSLAWALTIHRSQGSEFDEVLVVLPHHESPMATRELIYTAITRAKRTVYIAGDLASIRTAASSPSSRVTMVGNHFCMPPVHPLIAQSQYFMARHPHPAETRRSEHWLRLLIYSHPAIINQELQVFPWAQHEEMTWLSPLIKDAYAEYSDREFLEWLGVQLDGAGSRA